VIILPVSFAKTLAGSEINNLHTFLNPSVCYHCCPCSTSSDFGWAHFPAVFTHVRAFCLKIWRFDNSSLY
jgi:hypothetical protein